jgi:hypothetical protein
MTHSPLVRGATVHAHAHIPQETQARATGHPPPPHTHRQTDRQRQGRDSCAPHKHFSSAELVLCGRNGKCCEDLVRRRAAVRAPLGQPQPRLGQHTEPGTPGHPSNHTNLHAPREREREKGCEGAVGLASWHLWRTAPQRQAVAAGWRSPRDECAPSPEVPCTCSPCGQYDQRPCTYVHMHMHRQTQQKENVLIGHEDHSSLTHPPTHTLLLSLKYTHTG